MGTTVSKGVLTPLSIVSIAIGFLSFSFTLLTFVRVFWSEIDAIIAAPREARNMLGNLSTALHEEREHLRAARRRCSKQTRHGHREEVSLRIMQDTVRDMIRQLREIERPFLVIGEEPIWDGDAEHFHEDINDKFRSINLTQRIIWTRKRGTVKSLMDTLQKLQVRRIGWQVDKLARDARSSRKDADVLDDIDDAVFAINEKLSRVVGVRRVD